MTIAPLDVIVPAGIDDAQRPSGGNYYDRRVIAELGAAGRPVRETPVPGTWPYPSPDDRRLLAAAFRSQNAAAPVLIDGLIACGAPDLVRDAASTRPLVVLAHMPFGPNDPALAKAEAELLPHVARIVVTSEWTRAQLETGCGVPASRIIVAPPGVEAAELATVSADGGRLLCVAAVVPAKGHRTLVDALAQVADSPWHCTCPGSLDVDPRAADELVRLVGAYGLQRRVRMPGAVGRSQLADLLASTDLLVVPSLADSYGMVVTEALARGIPAVASDVGGIPEAIGRASDGTPPGILVPPGDPQALADALRRWFHDARLRHDLRSAALSRRAGLRGWGVTAARVADAIRAAEQIGGRSPSLSS